MAIGRNINSIDVFTLNATDILVKRELEKTFKGIKRINNLRQANEPLYKLITQASGKHNLGIKQYLGKLGYTYMQNYQFGNSL